MVLGTVWVRTREYLEGYVRFEGPDGPEVLSPPVWPWVDARFTTGGRVLVSEGGGPAWMDLSGLALDQEVDDAN